VSPARSTPEPAALFGRQPVAQPDAQTSDALHASDACGEFRAEESGVGRLVGHPTHRGQAQINRGRRILPLLEVDAIAQDDGAVERETWLRAVPRDELTNGVIVGPLSAS
jgi:hypothetical protein